MSSKTALVLRHLCFEDLGAFEVTLKDAGYAIRYCEMGVDDPVSFGTADMLIILGGPIGAYEEDLYPFLTGEIALIAAHLKANKPTLGICLGAQLMARALGARVYPGRAKEIGWIPLTLSAAGADLLAPFEGHPVLHWHGDTFDLPQGAVHLAATPDCDQQAFSYGRHALAFQFHPEAGEKGFERWLIGHAGEIAATKGVSVPALRASMREHGAASAARGQRVLLNWLAGLS
jgi:GMP synthase (glutamine-hydrolysing)